MNEIFYKQYVFLEYINDLIKENLKKFKNLSIIINIDKKDEENIKNECSIVKFAKKNKIPFMFKNSFQKSIKYNANGIFINSTNKKIIKPILLKKNFWIIGGAHNQMEYSKKIDQTKFPYPGPFPHPNPKVGRGTNFQPSHYCMTTLAALALTLH